MSLLAAKSSRKFDLKVCGCPRWAQMKRVRRRRAALTQWRSMDRVDLVTTAHVQLMQAPAQRVARCATSGAAIQLSSGHGGNGTGATSLPRARPVVGVKTETRRR